jgi:6-phosphogluconolactonase (cycloisomerase 2 family)
MTLSRIGRISKALVVSMAVVLGMSACGGYTVGFMWVTGTQYNQIAGFKIDDFTGNLTTMVNSPYSSGGANPVSIAVRLGGNFVFVVNKGTTNAQGQNNGDGNVSVFAVGEDGILTFQQSYSTAGNTPVWAATDSSGSYLYVLDQRSPAYGTVSNVGGVNVTDLNGDITVFSIDGNTGRLQLVPNQLIKNAQGQQLNYFEVGPTPTMVRVGGGCVYTLNSGDQSILPYGVGSQGQLVVEANSRTLTQTVNMTSLNVSGGNIYITDAGTNSIKPYTTGSNCSLSAQVGGSVANLPQTSNPVFSMTDGKGKYLYVLNHGTSNVNNPNSTISAFVIQPTGALTPVSDISNPYPTGNGPVCMVEDPSNQYVYTANSNDGTVTGKRIDPQTGQLYDLTRGSSFQATGLATCLGVSGNVD